jgi:hypothetical protein
MVRRAWMGWAVIRSRWLYSSPLAQLFFLEMHGLCNDLRRKLLFFFALAWTVCAGIYDFGLLSRL